MIFVFTSSANKSLFSCKFREPFLSSWLIWWSMFQINDVIYFWFGICWWFCSGSPFSPADWLIWWSIFLISDSWYFNLMNTCTHLFQFNEVVPVSQQQQPCCIVGSYVLLAQGNLTHANLRYILDIEDKIQNLLI